MELDILPWIIDTDLRDRDILLKDRCRRRARRGGDQILGHLLSMACAGIIAPHNVHMDSAPPDCASEIFHVLGMRLQVSL